MNLYKKLTLLGVLFAAMLTAQADPDLLITVNESNPSDVIFTATLNSPLASDSSHFFGEGIDITSFFTSDVGLNFLSYPPGTGSNLLPTVNGSSTYYYSGVTTDNLSGSYADINAYNVADSLAGYGSDPQAQGVTPEIFSTSNQALSGFLFLDLSDYASSLPAVGTIGDIYAGNSLEGYTTPPGAIPLLLGQWEVTVPEPGVLGYLLLGAVILAAIRLVRTRKSS